MSLIRLNHVTKFYDPYLILDDISLSIEHGDRIGLIGKNGTGKTTLTEIIAGLIRDFKGSVFFAKGLKIGYLSQEPNLDPNCTVRQEALKSFQDLQHLEDEMLLVSQTMERDDNPALLDIYARLQEQHENKGGYSYEHQIDRTLGGLGFDRKDFHLRTAALSGGQKTRVTLAKLLLEHPDLLLLDEPSNHLDIKASEWLENFLNAEYRGAALIVSHDRYFLDRVTQKIWELHQRKVKIYKGNYTSYSDNKQLESLTHERAYKKQLHFIAHEEEFIQKNIAGQRTREAQGRRTLLNRIERIEKPETNARKMKIRFTPKVRGGNDILQCQRLGMRYGKKTVFKNLSVEIYRQDVLGIIGPNGSGKTTFLRLILGHQEPTDGELKIGANLQMGYYDQELASLNPDNEIIREIWQLRPKHTQEDIRNFLGRFLFSDDEVFKQIKDLSGGEQSRVMLAKLLLQDANVLLLDEPTNHLDIASREALEDALKEYEATIFIISHDRYLLNNLATKLLIFKEDTVKLFAGNYAEYEAHLQDEKQSVAKQHEQSPMNRKTSVKSKKGKTERVRVAASSKRSSKSKRRKVKTQRLTEI